jgi:hypothetical protein
MPPSNTTPETATVIASLPYALTVDPEGNDLWWTYTAEAGQTTTGWFAWAADEDTYRPWLSVYTGPDASNLDFYWSGVEARSPIMVPMEAGVQYWITVEDFGTPGGDLILSALPRPAASIVAGFIVVPGDATVTTGTSLEFDVPAMVLDADTGTVVHVPVDFPPGEFAGVLPDGGVLVEDITAVTTLSLRYPDLTIRATVTGARTGNQHPPICTNGDDTYYYADSDSVAVATLRTVSAAGVIGGASWTLPADSVRIDGIAVISNETTLCYVRQGVTADGAVHRYDLIAEAPLSDLAAAIAGYTAGDIINLSDDTLLVSYIKTSEPDDFKVIHYSAAGAVLHTYEFADALIDHITVSLLDPETFWVWLMPNWQTGVTSTYQEILIADGSVIREFSFEQWDSNLEGPYEEESPPRFGPPDSCPFFVTRALAPEPTYRERNVQIRRLRRSPHLSDDERWVFHQRFQLVMESGTGLVDGQGEDPQVMVRWSDDGGHTWSNDHWVSAGRIGEFKRRVILRRLGRARDRVYEVVVSDPVAWHLVSASLQLEGGQS